MTCRSRLATAPSSTGSGGPTAGASHPLPVPVSRFPSAFPRGFPLGWCPFPTWVYFYSCVPARRKGPGEATEISFFIHRMTAVIHASAGLSTASCTAYPQVRSSRTTSHGPDFVSFPALLPGITAPCRVVYVIDEPATRGFAYG